MAYQQSVRVEENSDFQQIVLPLELGFGERILQCTRLTYLAKEIYPGGNTESVVVSRIDAYARFSVRGW